VARASKLPLKLLSVTHNDLDGLLWRHQNLAFLGASTLGTSISGRDTGDVFGCSITMRMVRGEAAARRLLATRFLLVAALRGALE
jgi:hypothetical protein